MNIFTLINSNLTAVEQGAPLLSGIDIERHMRIGTDRVSTTLICYTSRDNPLNGGNGIDGIDGVDMRNIHNAVFEALTEMGSPHAVDNIVIRSAIIGNRSL